MAKAKLFLVLVLVAMMVGCSSTRGSHYDTAQATSVDLKTANYRILKSNAVGTDRGFKLLGFIPFSTPSYVDAMNDLRSQAPMENRAAALANVVQEESSLWLLLFSIPKITITADIIEFTKTSDSK
jgi:hypothetical protein